jgi:tetratricopeptide (TPR) repeat protein
MWWAVLAQNSNPPSTDKIEGIDFLLTTGHSLQSTNPDSSLFLGRQAMELSQKVEYTKGIANANLLIGTSHLLKENLDSASYYIKKSIRQTEYYNFEGVQSRAYSNYGIVMLYMGNLDSSDIYFHRALVLYNKTQNYQGAYKALNNLATVAILNDDYPLSLDYLFQCLELSDHLEDPSLLPRTYSNISSNYQNIGDYEEALKYLKKSMSYGIEEGDDELRISNTNKLGDIYLMIGDLESAHETFTSILKLYRGKNDCWLLESHLGMSDTYIEMEAMDSALAHANIAYDMAQDCGFFHFNYQTLFQKGNIYLAMGDYDQAEYNLKQCEESFSTMQIDEGFYELFAVLSDLYEKKGDYKKSLAYFKHYKALQDSSLNEQKLRDLSRLDMNKEFAAE